MQILRFTDFLLEHQKFGGFEGSIPYTDWSDFKTKLQAVIKKGFKDDKELVSEMGLEQDLYEKVVNNMIANWKDSVSKSLLHAIGELRYKLPNKGDNIFEDLVMQTRFLLIAGSGIRQRDMFGDTNGIEGLRILSMMDVQKVRNKKPKNDDDKFVTIGGAYALVPATDHMDKPKQSTIDKVNKIMQYVWLYAFYHHYKVKKDPKVAKKMPKYLYRGVRGLFGNKKQIQDLLKDVKSSDIYSKKNNIDTAKQKYDKVVDYIVAHGINKIADGKMLSFTAAKPIANYFANKEGMIIRIDPSKVDVVSSELTEPQFKETDYVSNKKEREYIVRIPDNYKFNKEDIEIVNLDYLMGAKNPLAVQQFNHDDIQAVYDMHGWTIRARWYWRTNEKGSIVFSAEKPKYEKGEYEVYSEGRLNAKKALGFDPMPTEDNLKDITNFKLRHNKSSYGSNWEDL